MAPNYAENEEADLVSFGSYNSTGMDIAKATWIKEIVKEFKIEFFVFIIGSGMLKRLTN